MRVLCDRSVVSETGCWDWVKALDRDGYPERVRVSGERIRPYRLALRLRGIEVPEGMVVRHLCHNRKCVNPDHLTYGTQAENIQDSVQANRHVKGDSHALSKFSEAERLCISERLAQGEFASAIAAEKKVSVACICRIARGEAFGTTPVRKGMRAGEETKQAKITDRQACEIKALAKEGYMTQKEIGNLYGIDASQVSRIKTGKAWVKGVSRAS